MKKSFKVLTLAITATVALTASAAAANFDHCADQLKNLGLFSGGASGYELDKAPTRAEAGVMLVRLLGKESDAKALTYSAPFTDLKGWEQPYIQYLYDNGLTSGATATTFEPNGVCSGQMYTTFLLRALGYSDKDGGDFTYATAVNKAKEVGLIDYANYSETGFVRDHVAAMSLTALSEQPKGETTTTLLDKLVADGAISSETAKPVQDFFTNMKAYSVAEQSASKLTKYQMDMTMAMNASMAGQKVMTMDMKTKILADMNMTTMDKSKMAMSGTMVMEMDKSLVADPKEAKVEMPIEYYYTDGAFYMNMAGEKITMPMSYDKVFDQIGGAALMSTTPISIIKSITVTGDTYAVVCAGNAMMGMADTVVASMNVPTDGTGDVAMKMGDVSMSYTTKGDQMQDMKTNMTISMTVEGETLDMVMDMTAKVTGTGDSVKIVLPTDLATYTSAPAA